MIQITQNATRNTSGWIIVNQDNVVNPDIVYQGVNPSNSYEYDVNIKAFPSRTYVITHGQQGGMTQINWKIDCDALEDGDYVEVLRAQVRIPGGPDYTDYGAYTNSGNWKLIRSKSGLIPANSSSVMPAGTNLAWVRYTWRAATNNFYVSSGTISYTTNLY